MYIASTLLFNRRWFITHLFNVHVHNFMQLSYKTILGTHDTGGIYLQGILSGSEFVDDDGQIMNYFQWMDGEPGSGEHVCFDDDTLKQEACSGGSPNQFICRFYF